jgi:hypothetical protein
VALADRHWNDTWEPMLKSVSVFQKHLVMTQLISEVCCAKSYKIMVHCLHNIVCLQKNYHSKSKEGEQSEQT